MTSKFATAREKQDDRINEIIALIIKIQRELPTLDDDSALALAIGQWDMAQSISTDNSANEYPMGNNFNHEMSKLESLRDNLTDDEIGRMDRSK